ncbi:CBS domain-containing protein [Anianabacter salinae]|uniref:CBS domain-containing protein n=1 Tax=Anianabacter salinae TaxID=2851023 RepID=UPI00225E5651|nr:CBS domain-containing protein [Anianabacter salinae]MBV0911527.1 CBS domain-containing protein [Anianabacter salinae]
MLVHQILKAKSDDGVVTVRPDMSIDDAIKLLSERRIGAVIVTQDDKTPLGILSERDVVREMGRRGTACLTDTVGDMMTKDLVGCSRHDTADAVLTRMTDGRFRHMPVLEDGEMVGLISIGDVVKARLAELSMEKSALEGMIMGH